jgi:hypothetical protein
MIPPADLFLFPHLCQIPEQEQNQARSVFLTIRLPHFTIGSLQKEENNGLTWRTTDNLGFPEISEIHIVFQ